MLAPIMTMREGGAIYAPAGALLEAGDRLEQRGLARALELVADEGGRTMYAGSLARGLLGLMEERRGLVTAADLAAYRPRWLAPASTSYAGTRISTRAGLRPLPEALDRLPSLHSLSPAARVLALVESLDARDGGGDTTNLTVLDGEGNACVVTTSLGLGSGDFLPGFDLHLNSMLGEADLLVGPLEPGERMPSMIAPTVSVDDEGLVVAAGAAGGTRLRSALVQVLAAVLDEGLSAQEAVDRPRVHPAGDVVHLEPGFEDDVIVALESEGRAVTLWRERHHYFGGVSVIGRSGAAGDPRRSGAALQLR
jgi:gamma-glutamyltranspeptidase/glutathione hydrolase